MEAKQCKKCGALNALTSDFCEGCGKKLPKKSRSGSGGDGWIILILIAVIVGGGYYGYSMGYRAKDIPNLIKYVTHGVKAEPSVKTTMPGQPPLGTTPTAPQAAPMQQQQPSVTPMQTVPAPTSYNGARRAPVAPTTPAAPVAPTPTQPAAPMATPGVL